MVKEIFTKKKIFNIFLANSLSNFNFGNTNRGKNADDIFLHDKRKFFVSSKKKEIAKVAVSTYKILSSFVSNLTFDTTLIVNLVSTALLSLFKDSLTLVFLLCVMFYQNWKLSLIAMIMIPLASLAAKSLGKQWPPYPKSPS